MADVLLRARKKDRPHLAIVQRGEQFEGPEAGHVLKLRYTPLQHRVLSVEDEASPHRAAIAGFRSLEGTPVICADRSHSALAVRSSCAAGAASTSRGLPRSSSSPPGPT